MAQTILPSDEEVKKLRPASKLTQSEKPSGAIPGQPCLIRVCLHIDRPMLIQTN